MFSNIFIKHALYYLTIKTVLSLPIFFPYYYIQRPHNIRGETGFLNIKTVVLFHNLGSNGFMTISFKIAFYALAQMACQTVCT